MRLILLTCLTMVAFAANSVLNRLAVGSGGIDAESFALLRLFSGVVVLVLLARGRGAPMRQSWTARWTGGGSLTLYMLGFSLAYQTLDAGLGALILFGVVQVTMFGWGMAQGNRTSPGQLLGAGLALAGLAVVLWPTEAVAVAPGGVLFMIFAGLGWAAYSLAGRGSQNPLGATADNFVVSFVMTLCVLAVLGWPMQVTPAGAALAALSGGVTSGLGYALWYWVLPRLGASTAATVQLSVPVLALLAGVIVLGERFGVRLGLGGLAVIGGIALVVSRERSRGAEKTG